MLPQAVDAGEEFFLQEGGEAVLGDDLLDDLDDDQVLVDLDGVDSGANSNWPGGLKLVEPLVGAPPS